MDGGYELIAKDETFLRIFYATFLMELHGFQAEELFHPLDLFTFIPIIRTIDYRSDLYKKITQNTDDDISQFFHSYFYMVSLLRENQGYHIASNYKVDDDINEAFLTKISSAFKHITKENLSPIHDFIQKQFEGWDSTKEKEQVFKESQDFMKRLFSQTVSKPSKEKVTRLNYILVSLYLTAKYRPQKTSTLFDRIYYFGLYAKNQNSYSYELVEKNMEVFSKNVGLSMKNHINDAFFWICLMYPPFKNYSKHKNVLIISDFGKQHSQFLSELLSNTFNRDSMITISIDIAETIDSLTSEKLQSYDILITTIVNLPFEHKKIILVNDYLTADNLIQIYKEVY